MALVGAHHEMLYTYVLTELAYNYSSTDANQLVLTRPTISTFGNLKISFAALQCNRSNESNTSAQNEAVSY